MTSSSCRRRKDSCLRRDSEGEAGVIIPSEIAQSRSILLRSRAEFAALIAPRISCGVSIPGITRSAGLRNRIKPADSAAITRSMLYMHSGRSLRYLSPDTTWSGSPRMRLIAVRVHPRSRRKALFTNVYSRFRESDSSARLESTSIPNSHYRHRDPKVASNWHNGIATCFWEAEVLGVRSRVGLG